MDTLELKVDGEVLKCTHITQINQHTPRTIYRKKHINEIIWERERAQNTRIFQERFEADYHNWVFLLYD